MDDTLFGTSNKRGDWQPFGTIPASSIIAVLRRPDSMALGKDAIMGTRTAGS